MNTLQIAYETAFANYLFGAVGLIVCACFFCQLHVMGHAEQKSNRWTFRAIYFLTIMIAVLAIVTGFAAANDRLKLRARLAELNNNRLIAIVNGSTIERPNYLLEELTGFTASDPNKTPAVADFLIELYEVQPNELAKQKVRILLLQNSRIADEFTFWLLDHARFRRVGTVKSMKLNQFIGQYRLGEPEDLDLSDAFVAIRSKNRLQELEARLSKGQETGKE